MLRVAKWSYVVFKNGNNTECTSMVRSGTAVSTCDREEMAKKNKSLGFRK